MISRDLIIKTATKLFLQHGVRSITTDRIVKELHTSKRTIYSHFQDKVTLLRACLDHYHASVRSENEEIIRSSENAIEAMGHLHQKIIVRSHQVNPNFYTDLTNYYPGLLHESYSQNGSFAHEQLMELAKWGIEDGIFDQDMDIPVVGKTVLCLVKLLGDNDQFPANEFSKERLTFGIMLPYMRGLCTAKGIKILNVQEELFRVTI